MEVRGGGEFPKRLPILVISIKTTNIFQYIYIPKRKENWGKYNKNNLFCFVTYLRLKMNTRLILVISA